MDRIYLVIWFGAGSWLSVNCIWVELPVIVEHLPEKWKLPSYLTVIIQVANIGPILITIMNKVFGEKINHKLLICALLALGVIATLLLAFLWSTTAYISGSEHSVGLFALVFLIAFVNCSSSVTFIPYMAAFRHEYVTAFFIGSGLSGLIPAVISLSQGIGGNNDCLNVTHVNTTTINDTPVNVTDWVLQPVPDIPNFSVRSFFIAATVFMLLSMGAFIALITWPLALSHQTHADGAPACKPKGDEDGGARGRSGDGGSAAEKVSLTKPSDEDNGGARDRPAGESPGDSETSTTAIGGHRQMPLLTFVYLLLLVCIVNGLSNTALYSVQTYSCLPYGNMAYHLSVVLSSVANPVGAFIPFCLATSSSLALTALTTIACALSSFIFLTAALSPNPPLVHEDGGKALVILAWTLTIGLLTYVKTLLAGTLRTEGRRGLLWCGILTQLGSAIGAFTLFPLINVYNVFEGSYTCNAIITREGL